MGKDGYVRLVNDTDSNWTLTHQRSFQMEWNFPKTIAAGKSHCVRVEFKESLSGHLADDSGEAVYSVDGTQDSFQVQALASQELKLQIYLQNMATKNSPKGSILDLGWNGGEVQFALAGTSGSYLSSGTATACVESDGYGLRSCALSNMCIPSLDDAEMSADEHCTAGAARGNMKTRRKNIKGLLGRGVRSIDMRPAFNAMGSNIGMFYGCHCGYAGDIGPLVKRWV